MIMFSCTHRRALTGLVLVFASGTCAIADGVIIVANHDNTIVSDQPDNSNGGTDGITVGRNNQGSIRRGLVSFDVFNAIPAGSTITNVILTMNLSQGQGSHKVSIHRALTEWGEGTATGTAGQSAPAGPGDATWTSNHFGSSLWTLAGGDFAAASANTTVNAAAPGLYQWSSTGMIADVNAWIANSATNFGWFLIGIEGTNQTAMRFDSRENDSEMAPTLTIEYTVPTPGAMGLLGLGALAVGRRRR